MALDPEEKKQMLYDLACRVEAMDSLMEEMTEQFLGLSEEYKKAKEDIKYLLEAVLTEQELEDYDHYECEADEICNRFLIGAYTMVGGNSFDNIDNCYDTNFVLSLYGGKK